MRPDLVVVAPLGRQHRTRLPQRGEHGLVQTLVSQPAVEGFFEGILRRLAGCHVAHHRRRIATRHGDRVQFARDTPAGQRRVRHQRQAFAGETVYHAQYTEPTPIR